MAKTVTRIAHLPKLQQRKRVAAYARVSSGKDAMLHSLSAQVSYYNNLIQGNGQWEFAGVYSDEAITGTKEERPGFQHMLEDCRKGKIDLILTKSISRLARNTVTLLETVRGLKALGVDIFFEEQNIHSMSSDGELMMTILASYAQEESRSASENQKWRIRRNFESGMPWTGMMLGYRYDHGTYVIEPTEAETVRLIFDSYLAGMGIVAIEKMLNERGLTSRQNRPWGKNSVMCVLRNYTYTGNLLLQKTFIENHMAKYSQRNTGELPQYHITGSHEAIIPLVQFNAVQEEIEKRSAKYARRGIKQKTYPFTGLLVCENCGKHYRRKVTQARVLWACPTYNFMGKAACPSKQIPEDRLISATLEAVGSLDDLHSKITAIRVEKNNRLVFCFKDGTTSVKRWQAHSRAESWTPEMREKARQKAHERNQSQWQNK